VKGEGGGVELGPVVPSHRWHGGARRLCTAGMLRCKAAVLESACTAAASASAGTGLLAAASYYVTVRAPREWLLRACVGSDGRLSPHDGEGGDGGGAVGGRGLEGMICHGYLAPNIAGQDVRRGVSEASRN